MPDHELPSIPWEEHPVVFLPTSKSATVFPDWHSRGSSGDEIRDVGGPRKALVYLAEDLKGTPRTCGPEDVSKKHIYAWRDLRG